MSHERKCQRCGTCCKSISFALRDVLFDKDEREIGKWAHYHMIGTQKYDIDGVDYLAINFPFPCVHLKKLGHITECAIYESRPKVCKDYFCKEVTNVTFI